MERETLEPREAEHRASLRQRAFEILEHSRRRDLASRIVDGVLVALIVANVAVVIAQSVPEVAAQYGGLLTAFDRLCVLIFAIEYAARIWVAPEHLMLRGRGDAMARLRFAGTPLMVIDALAIAPFFLELLFPASSVILLTRLVRILKLARYSPAIATIGRVLALEKRALLACVVILTGVLITAAAVMLAVEGHKQPERLGDMPKAMWWAAAMLAKIGGGETEPVTALGRIVAAITVMLGIFCFALPVAIIGRGFYEEIRRRDFVVTFAMVARVPLFSRFDAAAIADLVSLLRARTVTPGTQLMRKGDRGDAMYFIASGVVEVAGDNVDVRLTEGDFFGEMALLSREPRTATVTAVSSADLLVLDVDDFMRLVDRLPQFKSQIEEIARERKEGKADGGAGDRDEL
ncbi:MAG: cyclic nucleotide-binding domain-containing protein [Alphaproteobacteria bacterium]|nr:cyclic nucleotide-binding domain-containing protein [Alphaproteobacteria bacterium]